MNVSADSQISPADRPFEPGHMPFTREGVQQMLIRWQSLREQGFTDKSSPEFAEISNYLRIISNEPERYRQLVLQHQQRLQQQQQLPQQNQQQQQMYLQMQNMQQFSQSQPQQSVVQSPVVSQPQLIRNSTAPVSQAPANGITHVNGTLPFNQNVNPRPAASLTRTSDPNIGAAAPASGSSPAAGTAFTAEQLQMLRTQITAFKLLSKNMIIPLELQRELMAPFASALQKQQQSQHQSRPPSGAAPTPQVAASGPAIVPQIISQQTPQPQVSIPATTVPVPSVSNTDTSQASSVPPQVPSEPLGPKFEIVSPYLQVQQPISYADFVSRQNRLLIPSIMPSGVDIIALKEQREISIRTRVASRIAELESLPANLSSYDAKDLSSELSPNATSLLKSRLKNSASNGEVAEESQEETKDTEDIKPDILDEIKSEEKPKEEPDATVTIVTGTLSGFTADDKLKVKALIELKSLRMLTKQRDLRSKVLKSVAHFNNLALTASRSTFRRTKKQNLREARLTEELERQQRAEREKRERQRNLDYLIGVCNHGNQITELARARQTRHQRLGKAVLAYHAHTEREEQRRAERTAKQRLQALKANDEEAYLKLLDQTKDTRITHLLRQTNSFLDSLAQAVKDQQRENAAENSEIDDLARVSSEEGVDEEETENLDYYNVAHRIHEIVSKQPSILVGGTLKEYQLKGLQWMVSLFNNNLNGILADEMGLGKTIQTISLITYLIEIKQQPGPYLVIVPLSTLTNWTLEFEKWAPSVKKIVYKGPPLARRAQQGAIRAGDFQVLLTTYEYIIKDRPILSKIKWLHMIIDEGHRMKNAQSKLSNTLTLYYHSKFRLILTGTPLQNNLPELWALLNFVLPKIFNSVKSFDEWFNTPFANTGSQDKMELSEEETLLIIRRLHKVLRPFLLRRLKKDVEKDLPDKVEKVIKCKMSALQMKLYEQMLKYNMLFVGTGPHAGGTKSGLKGLSNQIMQLRKICNHPFVFEEVENLINPDKSTNDDLWRTAGKFELLDRMLPKFKTTGHRVLMFFQMTQIMDIMEDFLRLRGMEYLRLDGGTKAEDRSDLLKLFNAPDSPYFAFLLSTRAGGLGLNLQTADTVIIYDTDWNPHQDLQAQDRAHRIGQTKEVRIFRLITEDSVEEMILERAHQKLDIDGKVIQAGKFDNKSTSEEQEAFLRSLLEAEEAKKHKRDDDDEDLDDEELNELLARNDEEAQIFRRIDSERNATSIYGKGKSRDRLYSEKELPDVYKKDMVVEILEQEDDMSTGRGARKRKVTRYDDGLTEKQWLDALEDDDFTIEDAIEKNTQKKEKRGRKRRH
ncbi:SNF2 family N-terminal domain-containing protein [Lipomyces oligophaga]|uniref:SNF2 family N-terminal domain-containing protein n=1 Tax=Lipomyces oligophaga TaxID=45792 RepID=UPI0034CD46B0